MSKKISWFEYLQKEMKQILSNKRIIGFSYWAFISLTGFVILYILAEDDFPTLKTFQVMIPWLLLVIVYPTFERARQNITPFQD